MKTAFVKRRNMLNQLYENVKLFNNLAGNKPTKQGFINQSKVIKEEANEIAEGIENNDIQNILKETIDTLYTAMGQLYNLEQLGCDVEGAVKHVGEENLTKYPNSQEIAAATISFYNSKNVNTYWEYNKDYERYVIKDSNGKIRKPVNFIPTDFTQYVPESLQRKGLE